MPNDHFRYAVELYRNDGASAGQFPVEIDWEPIRQWVRLDALRRDDSTNNHSNACPARPCWDDALGKPYVSDFQPVTQGPLPDDDQRIVATRFLGSRALTIANKLIDEGELESDAYTFRVLAYPMSAPEPAPLSISVESADTDPPVTAGNLAEQLCGASQFGDLTEQDMPVFVPQRVLNECRLLTAAAGEQETGGILIGGLRRDDAKGALYLKVSAQITAEYTLAAETSLAFTPETWTQVQAAIDLRRRNEIMLGWWHSHPVKAWCSKCPPEKRKKCPLLVDFFSAQDRLLHRAVFPAAYSIALVVNELADDKQTIAMFGWRQAMLVQRGFQILEATRPVETAKGSIHTQEELR